MVSIAELEAGSDELGSNWITMSALLIWAVCALKAHVSKCAENQGHRHREQLHPPSNFSLGAGEALGLISSTGIVKDLGDRG